MDQDQNAGNRLHRRPDHVDGLSPDKLPDHAPAPSAERRSEESAKPYTAEREDYGDDAVRGPDDPVEREDARRRTDRGGKR